MRLSADRSAGTENRKQIAEIVRHRIGSPAFSSFLGNDVVTATAYIPAALAARMPESESSHTAHFFGRHSRIGGSLQKNIGSGLEIYNIRPGNDRGKIGNFFSYAPEVAFDLYPVGGGCDRAGKAAALKLAKKRNRPRHNVNELSRVLAEEAVRFLLHPFVIRHAVHLRNAADICAVSHSAKPR